MVLIRTHEGARCRCITVMLSAVRSAGLGQLGEVSAGCGEVGSAVAGAGVRSAVVPAEGVVTGKGEDGLPGTGGAALLGGRQTTPGQFVDPPRPCLSFEAVTAGSFCQHAVYAKSSCGAVQPGSGGMAAAEQKPSTDPVSSGQPVTDEAV